MWGIFSMRHWHMMVPYLENLLMWKQLANKHFLFMSLQNCHYKKETTKRRVVSFFSLSCYKTFQSRPSEEKKRERLFMIFSILWNKARSLLRVEQIMFSKKKFLSEKQEASVTYKTCWIWLQLNSGSVRCLLNNLEHRSKEKVITEGVWLYVQY